MTTHQSEHLDLEVHHKDHCIVEFAVKVNPSLVKTAHHSAVKELSKEVSIPGFRKGKAPESLIVKKYASQIDEKWKSALADLAFKEAEKLAGIPILSETRIGFEAEKVSLEEGAVLKFSFESDPSVPPVDFAKLSLPEIKEEIVDEKQIEERINEMREYFGTWHTIADRPVKEGDYVTLSVYITETDPEEEALSNVRFKVTPDKMAKWMRDLAIGLQVGESKEGISTPDADAPQEVKDESPPKKVRLLVTNLQSLELAPLDEALAKKMGAASVEEFTTRMKELLVKQAHDKYQSELREKISESLVDTHPFDLPQSLIRKETEFRLRQLLDDHAFQERLKVMTPEAQKEEITNLQHYSARAIRLFYLCRALVDENKLEIAESDLQSLNFLINKKEERSMAVSRLMLRTAQDFLIEKTLAKK